MDDRPPEAQEPPPRVTREDLQHTLDFIDRLQNATLKDSGLTDKQLERLLNPPQQEFEIEDKDTLLSIKLFLAVGNASEETYKAVADAIKDHSPEIEILSLAQVQFTRDVGQWQHC